MLRRIFILLAAIVALANVARASEFDAQWYRANTAYMNGDWAGATAIYDSIEQAGMASVKLYYNMGGAYFKNGQIGKAVLYYNKALRIDPTDEDTQYNLRVANGYVKDQIEVGPEFFVSRWVRSVRTAVNSNTWAVLSLVAGLLMLVALMIYLLPLGLGYRKAGFAVAVVMGAFTLLSANFASEQRRNALHSSEAIVMIGAAPVKSSPDRTSKDIFVIHEGTQVTVLDRLGDWCQVSIADGNKGWMPASSIELID